MSGGDATQGILEELLPPLLEHLDAHDPGEIIGVWLCGSAASSGIRPDSDVDILVITGRSLTNDERSRLVELLLRISGWSGHRERFPDAASRRPLEVTFLALPDFIPLTSRPRRDFQYGEWLREELSAGVIPEPTADPDCVILLATALQSCLPLRGKDLRDVVAPVPPELLRHALIAQAPVIVSEVEGDERNALLTLARILVTLETGDIVSKDAAAQLVAKRLPPPQRELLETARAGYLGTVRDDWSTRREHARALASSLADEILRQDD